MADDAPAFTLPDNYYTVLLPTSKEQTKPDLLSGIIQYVLLGVVTHQTIAYMTRPANNRTDTLFTKVVIYGSQILNTILAIFTTLSLWNEFVNRYGDFDTYFAGYNYWAQTYGSLFPGLAVLLLIQSYWVRMIWQIGETAKGFRPAAAVCGVLMVLNAAMTALGFSAYFQNSFRNYQIGGYTSVGATALTDMIISVSLLTFFIRNRHKTTDRTRNMFSHFIRYFFATGFCFTVLSLVQCALPTNGWVELPNLTITFVMQMCLMSTILGRDELIEEATQKTHSLGQSTLPTSNASRSEKTVMSDNRTSYKLGKSEVDES